MQKVLTIAMPCYNVEAYIRRGLDSLANSAFAGRLEVIVVNDGSTDKTQAIAQEYVEKYPSIFKLVNKENGGHGSAVNAGIAHASGKYFRVVDGDDWVNAEGLARTLDELERTDASIVIDEKTEVDMTSGSRKQCLLPAKLKKLRCCSFDKVCQMPECEQYITIHTLNVKTQLLRDNKIALQEGIFYVDLQYVVLATCFAKTVEFCPANVYQYLLGNASQSVSFASYANRYAHHRLMIECLLKFASENSLSQTRQDYLEYRICQALNTNYNIGFIYDTNRKRGSANVKAFYKWLQSNYPKFAQATRKRFCAARLLHLAGVSGPALEKLRGRG